MKQSLEPNSPLSASAYTPPTAAGLKTEHRLKPLNILLAAVLAIFAYALWFVLTAQGVSFSFEPEADSYEIHGGLAINIAGNRLMRPGEYQILAKREGYYPIDRNFTVDNSGEQRFDFNFEPLPGKLSLNTTPADAEVFIDGQPIGKAPLDAYELAGGSYTLMLKHPRYQDFDALIDIEGFGKHQSMDMAMRPNWAEFALSSEPSGADIYLDGELLGQTPASIEVIAGQHSLRLEKQGFRHWQRDIFSVAEQDQTLATAELEPAWAQYTINTEPSGAKLSLGGEYQGETPISLEIKPGKDIPLRLNKAGYSEHQQSITAVSGEQQNLTIPLRPVYGKVKVLLKPADAELWIDGEKIGRNKTELTLTATEHTLEWRRKGYRSEQRKVTPRPGFAQRVKVYLLTEEEAYYAQFKTETKNSLGQNLRLLRPGKFTMGSNRREQGRQANEVQRDIALTKPFYIATTETTNAQFKQFKASHSSGIIGRKTLSNAKQPVVRVSWAEAVAFCNWLSRREGLPQAYRDGKLIRPFTTGYRLPTEAEWAWAARFAGGVALKYPWGQAMPPSPQSGNFADVEASSAVAQRLSNYRDGFPASAPVAQFKANRLGLFDMGGNVMEWVSDSYGAKPSLALETDPVIENDSPLHVIRGSSWRHGRITQLRLAFRDSGSEGRDDLGFRVARYVD